jgi:hypothetical protein
MYLQSDVSLRRKVPGLNCSYVCLEWPLDTLFSYDAAAYAEDAPASLKAMAAAESFTFPFCYDETQAVAKAYTAACTPDFFLFDRQRKLVYRGQLDASRPGNQIPVTGKDLRAAIEAVLADQPINPVQKPSLGCNIKWKKGNEPAYFLRRVF